MFIQCLFFPMIEIFPKEYWCSLKVFYSFFITCDKIFVYHKKKKKRILQRGKKYNNKKHPKKQNCQTTYFGYVLQKVPDEKILKKKLF